MYKFKGHTQIGHKRVIYLRPPLFVKYLCSQPGDVITIVESRVNIVHTGVASLNLVFSDPNYVHCKSFLLSSCWCRQLLNDCGIGLEVSGEEELTSVVGQHRALLFCQYKSMLDIIERDLFK